MASIIPGFEYDIFISYRQKDNKYDGWVAEFVDNLKHELEATFKEEIGVYFDINPHDGLLETHDVAASLKEKLRSVVFIPILSRTYCDPNSFAWEHEFIAFIDQASKDDFGLKVKLQYGNIGNRVLPVVIHDLDSSDIKICEAVLGSVLRGVDFIYKSSGVNRPLRFKEDRPQENQKNTIYRDQINKVSLAIKEIIKSMSEKVPAIADDNIIYDQKVGETTTVLKKPALKRFTHFPEKNVPLRVAIIAALIIAAVIFYPKLFSRGERRILNSGGRDISVAIMPFENNTNDTLWNIWQVGIQDVLVSSLSNTADIKVMQPQTVNSLVRAKGITNYASVSPNFASLLSRDLDANFCIFGSIKQVGNTIRLNASIFDPKKESIFKSHTIDGTSDDILRSIDSLSGLIQNSIMITSMIGEYIYSPSYQPTHSPEAYRNYLSGEDARAVGKWADAREFFTKALELDSAFSRVTLMMSVACKNQGLYDEGREWAQKAYQQRDKMDTWTRLLTEKNYASFFKTADEEIRYYKSMLEIDDKYPGTYYDFGLLYNNLEQYDKAIPQFEKSLELYKKFDTKPFWFYNYSLLGWAYLKTGQFKKVEKLYVKAEEDFPGEAFISHMRAVLSLIRKDTISAKKHIEDYVSIRRLSNWSEAGILYNLGEIYKEAGYINSDPVYMDIAEEYHRQEIVYEPGNMWRKYDVAWFLIETGRNLDEGLELIENALEMNGTLHYHMLDGKGWGLYKKGRYDEALNVLEQARDLSPFYYHSINKHIEEVKKAIAKQKES